MKRIIFFVVIFAVCIGYMKINKVTLSNDFSVETAQYMEQHDMAVVKFRVVNLPVRSFISIENNRRLRRNPVRG
jgi:hypothetical protein